MILPYFVGLLLGINLGTTYERTHTSYYFHPEKISNLEKKLKEYERLFGKIN